MPMEKDPFRSLNIFDWSFLHNINTRTVCPTCAKSRKYFCYNCRTPLAGTSEKIPKVQLPVQVDVIQHEQECESKSTAVHAALLAPGYVTIYKYPAMPTYKDHEKVVLVYPGKTSVTLETFLQCEDDALRLSPSNHKKSLDRVVFIDSTWYTVGKILQDERIQKLPCVKLDSYKTHFWRHQSDKPYTFLATVEAIYYFMKEYHNYQLNTSYMGEYDNLLFYFAFFYDVIQSYHQQGKRVKAYDEVRTGKKRKQLLQVNSGI